jgi:hypothetical protein
MPPAVQVYRGHEFPTTYLDAHGMRTLRVPTLFWLMDRVTGALISGSVHWYDLAPLVGAPVNAFTLSRNLELMESRGLIHAEPVYFGSSSPHLGNYQGFQYRYSLPDEVPS